MPWELAFPGAVSVLSVPRAPRVPEAVANGTRASRDAEDHIVAAKPTPRSPAAAAGAAGPVLAGPVLAGSVRTLILGIDYDGRIVQHDRIAPQILAREPDELLGAQLSDLTVAAQNGARQADGVAAVSGLLEAIRSDREGSAI